MTCRVENHGRCGERREGREREREREREEREGMWLRQRFKNRAFAFCSLRRPPFSDVMPFNVEDAHIQVTETPERSRGKVKGTPGTLVARALVDDTGDNGLAVLLV